MKHKRLFTPHFSTPLLYICYTQWYLMKILNPSFKIQFKCKERQERSDFAHIYICVYFTESSSQLTSYNEAYQRERIAVGGIFWSVFCNTFFFLLNEIILIFSIEINDFSVLLQERVISQVIPAKLPCCIWETTNWNSRTETFKF